MAKKNEQLEFKKVGGWGGKRKKAGRPNRTKTVNHMKRPRVDIQKPLHITQHLVKGVPSLRRKEFLHKFRACARMAQRYGLHVVHYALLYNHIHMIVEAENNRALSRGMRSLAGTFAKSINAKVRRTGQVFHGRFHIKLVRSPSQMKNTLEYVLLNRFKHDFDFRLDSYSTAHDFKHWRELMGRRYEDAIKEELAEPRAPDSGWDVQPRSWLASTGWKRAA